MVVGEVVGEFLLVVEQHRDDGFDNAPFGSGPDFECISVPRDDAGLLKSGEMDVSERGFDCLAVFGQDFVGLDGVVVGGGEVV